MTKPWVLILCFLLALAAGVASGVAYSHRQKPARGDRSSWLAQELDLNPEQRQQMRAIWDKVAAGGDGRSLFERRRELDKQRDEQLLNLLSAEQQAQYQQILQQHQSAIEALNQQRHELFEQARQQTRAILTAEQQAKYDALMSKMPGRGSWGAPTTAPGRSRHSPATMPAQER